MVPKFRLYLCVCALAFAACASESSPGPQSAEASLAAPSTHDSARGPEAAAATPETHGTTPSAAEGTTQPNAQAAPQPLEAAGEAQAGGRSPKQKVDACGLIKRSEIKSVQGVDVTEAKGSERPSGPFVLSQCYYTAVPFSKSVSLEVTRAGATTPGGQSLDAFWQRRFREAKRSKGADVPQPVAGVGDEAYWAGNDLIGSLYVKKGDRIIRISVGGKDEPEAKKRKSVSLARKVLERL